MILNSKVIVNVTTIRCFFLIEKRVWTMKNTILLLNNIISILDLFKILTYYIDEKKILEIRNKNINKDNIFYKFCRVVFLMD